MSLRCKSEREYKTLDMQLETNPKHETSDKPSTTVQKIGENCEQLFVYRNLFLYRRHLELQIKRLDSIRSTLED